MIFKVYMWFWTNLCYLAVATNQKNMLDNLCWSKEGWKFRGRGYIQLTGKDNYSEFSKFIGEDCVENPDLVSDKYPLASAAFFFEKNNLWAICDMGSSEDVVTKLTKRVNGGTHGLEDRLNKFNKYWSLLNWIPF